MAALPNPTTESFADVLADADLGRPLGPRLRALIAHRLDRLPLPGAGETLARWRGLAEVAGHDLALVKLFESHADALAILAELEPARSVPGNVAFAVYASESRDAPLRFDGSGALTGTKAWCSGARDIDRGLVTAVDADGRRALFEVDLKQPGVGIGLEGWHAVGMRDCASATVRFDQVPARQVGAPGAYLDRRGFWHGGMGVAACWFGAAARIGTRVRDLQVGRDDVHALMHTGAIDGELAAGAALLREAASAIDAHPGRDASHLALRLRTAVADLAERVIDHAMRAVGPGPLCTEPALARLVADLPIFVRQSRGEHDRVAVARLLLDDAETMARPGWTL